MAFKNYYEILGVQNFATNDQVRAGYRNMAAKYNSDTNMINEYKEELIKEVNEAIDVLSNIDKKHEFDKTLRALEDSMKSSLKDHIQHQEKNSPEVEHIIELVHKYFDKDKLLRERYENLLAAKARNPAQYFSTVKVIFVLIIWGATAYYYNPSWFSFIKGKPVEERKIYEWITTEPTHIYAKPKARSRVLYSVPVGFGFNTISETVHYMKVAFTDSLGHSDVGYVKKSLLKKDDGIKF